MKAFFQRPFVFLLLSLSSAFLIWGCQDSATEAVDRSFDTPSLNPLSTITGNGIINQVSLLYDGEEQVDGGSVSVQFGGGFECAVEAEYPKAQIELATGFELLSRSGGTSFIEGTFLPVEALPEDTSKLLCFAELYALETGKLVDSMESSSVRITFESKDVDGPSGSRQHAPSRNSGGN